MLKGKYLTDAVVGLATLALLLFEAYTLGNSHPSDTISETVWRAADKQPILVFAAGLLMGHWFWPRKETK